MTKLLKWEYARDYSQWRLFYKGICIAYLAKSSAPGESRLVRHFFTDKARSFGIEEPNGELFSGLAKSKEAVSICALAQITKKRLPETESKLREISEGIERATRSIRELPDGHKTPAYNFKNRLEREQEEVKQERLYLLKVRGPDD